MDVDFGGADADHAKSICLRLFKHSEIVRASRSPMLIAIEYPRRRKLFHGPAIAKCYAAIEG